MAAMERWAACAVVLAAGAAASAAANVSVAGSDVERMAITGNGVPEGFEIVHGCWPGLDGDLDGVRVLMPIEDAVVAHHQAQQNARQNDRSARMAGDNRVDLVFVGDGYTASQQAQFSAHVATVLTQLYSYEPMTSYAPYFRVTEVEVVSNESGVDNDPTQGVSRDTALDMAYWCNGIERLLCVNVSKAYAFANTAPDVDQVIALANSSKYGGAGYTSSDLGTSAGANGAAPQIVIHELGHSMGDLADEYTYGGPTNYVGGEPSRQNLSLLDSSAMQAAQIKWWRWLGISDPRFDSPSGTYEGGGYSVNGIYRPSNNSMMRNLNRPFNGISAERLIRAIYIEVDPIESHTSNDAPIPATETIDVTVMQPIGHALDVSWTLDGAPIAGADGLASLDLSTLGIASSAVVGVTVVDPTDMVRNEALRANLMTQQVFWAVEPAGCPADLNGDGSASPDDINLFVTNFVDAVDGNADIDGDGDEDADDIAAFVTAFIAGC